MRKLGKQCNLLATHTVGGVGVGGGGGGGGGGWSLAALCVLRSDSLVGVSRWVYAVAAFAPAQKQCCQ